MNTAIFLSQCKKNREILNLTYQDIANVLINMSPKEYEQFELGKKKTISKENLKRIYKVLCIEEPSFFNINDYIDTTNLNNDEILDLSFILEKLVGDIND